MRSGFIKRAAALTAAVFALSLPLSGCTAVKQSINNELSSAKNEVVSALQEAKEEVSSALSEAREEVSSALDEAQIDVSSALSSAREDVSSALGEAHGDIVGVLDEANTDLASALGGIGEGLSAAADELQEELLGDITTEAAKAPETTVDESTDTTTAPVGDNEWYTFRTKKQFDDHYIKHGAEFGDITQDEYLALANELIADTSDNILHKREKEDNDYLYFNTENNYFLVLSTDGYIRTFFIPSAGIKYWERQ